MTKFRRIVLATAVGLAVGLSGTAHAATATVPATPSPSPSFDGSVDAIVYAGSTVYVGGDFVNAVVGTRRYPRSRLAAFSALTGALLPWDPGADSTVRALAVDPVTGTVYAGGSFVTVGGQPRTGLAALDPVTGRVGPVDHGIAGTVRALAAGAGRVYAAGRFASVDGQVVGNVVAFNALTGAVDPVFRALADDAVDSLALSGDRLYLGGMFKQVDGLTGTAKLAAVDPVTGARDATFRPKLSIRVFGLSAGPTAVYAALGGTGGRAIRFSLDGTPQWTTTADGDVQAIGVLDDVVYFGGHFDNVCATDVNGAQGACVDGSVSRVKLAAVDASTGALLPWDPHANGVHGVMAVAVDSGREHAVAAGGQFTTIGGQRRARFAQFG